MPAIVPSRPLNISATGIVNAAAVGARDWQAVASAYNGLAGMGAALLPMGATSIALPSDDIATFRFRCWPRYQASHRIWIMNVSGEGAHTFTDPNGTVWPVSIPVSSGVGFRAFVEGITPRTGAETTLSVTFHCASTKTLAVHGFGCYELPRVALAVGGSDLTTADCGFEPTVLRTGLPIADDYAGAGLGFAARELDAIRDTARRCGMFAWASGGDGAVIVGTSFTTVLQAPPFALGRFLYNGQTTAKIQCAAYLSGAGSVRWTASGSGASVTASADSAGLVRAQLEIDCEDLAASDGRRSSRNESVLIEAEATTGSVTVESLTLGEGAPAASISAGATSGSVRRKPRFGRGPLPEFMSRKRRTR